ncbi:MAG: galactose-1-epimerase [Cytophagaceae bacterium]|nr:galactose-1-epimerase [Cytophagaceae bacterium]
MSQALYRKYIDPRDFKAEVNGVGADLYILKNKAGIEAVFSNWGQRLISLFAPDKNGVFEDIVLGYKTLDAYRNGPANYLGATLGRYGNRIANGRFSIDGKEFTLAQNNGGNNLHGGNIGFDSVIWHAAQPSPNKVVFKRTSPDGEEGFPGNLAVEVSYTLTEDSALIIEYTATTDAVTHINLSNHSYFNLKGESRGDIMGHKFAINANAITPVDENMIPVGGLMPVEDTCFDLRKGKKLKKKIDWQDPQIILAHGYDHNFVLNKNPKNEDGLPFAARVTEPKSGRVLEVFTTQPGMQFYTANWLDGKHMGKNGRPHMPRSAFCLEVQHFPDSPNHPQFPSTLLRPGEQYHSVCVYKLGIEK